MIHEPLNDERVAQKFVIWTLKNNSRPYLLFSLRTEARRKHSEKQKMIGCRVFSGPCLINKSACQMQQTIILISSFDQRTTSNCKRRPSVLQHPADLHQSTRSREQGVICSSEWGGTKEKKNFRFLEHAHEETQC